MKLLKILGLGLWLWGAAWVSAAAVETPQLVLAKDAPTHSMGRVAFSPDGRTLAIISSKWYRTVKLWDTTTGRERHILTGHTDEVSSVAFSPDGRMLASGSGDTTVKLRNVATGREVRTLTGHTAWVSSVVFSPDGRWPAAATTKRSNCGMSPRDRKCVL